MTDNKMIERAKQVFAVEIEGLEKTRDSIGASFAKAVRLILETVADGGIVVVSGVGKNLHIAEKMSAIFSSTGTRSIVLNPVQAMHGDLGMVSAKDVLIALSFSGESAEVNNLIPAIRRHGLKVISMTGRPDSTLAQMSDIHIEIPCGKEACPFGMAPTNSTTATMAMGDALAMVLIDAQKFPVEDYAMNHPAGAIGRALVMKVTDVMRVGEHLAKGIFTDGDFRRIVSTSADSNKLLASPVGDVMTKSPLFVYDDAYAAELLKIFEKKRIDDLPVCDRSGRVVGLVDIQDLPKMKVL